jgi:hypothetical protein
MTKQILSLSLLIGLVSGAALAQTQECWVCEFTTYPVVATYCASTAIYGRTDCRQNMSQTWCSVEGYPECTASYFALPSGQVVAAVTRAGSSNALQSLGLNTGWPAVTSVNDLVKAVQFSDSALGVTRNQCGMILNRRYVYSSSLTRL